MAKKKTEEMVQATGGEAVEMINKVIAIDCGKSNMKTIYGNNAYIFANKIDEGYGDSLNSVTWNVEYKGKKYYVGDGASGSDLGEGKGSIQHKIQALTTVCYHLDPTEKNDNIVLIYGESLDYYFDETHRDEIIDSLTGKHTMKINEEEYNFEIKKVHILPEGYGHIISNINSYLKGRCYVVDFGGRTMNFLTINNGAPVKEFSFSNEMGVYDLVGKCTSALKLEGFRRSDEEVESYIRYGTTEEIQSIIDRVALQHFKTYDDVLRKRKIDIHSLLKSEKVVFIGGGAVAFASVIKKHYGENVVIPSEPIIANVKGFYQYGARRFGRMEF